jgi:hypothetical protein
MRGIGWNVTSGRVLGSAVGGIAKACAVRPHHHLQIKKHKTEISSMLDGFFREDT